MGGRGSAPPGAIEAYPFNSNHSNTRQYIEPGRTELALQRGEAISNN